MDSSIDGSQFMSGRVQRIPIDRYSGELLFSENADVDSLLSTSFYESDG